MDEIPPELPGYRPTALLGTGATSRVWRARRILDDELVAVKILPGEADDAAVREFSLLQQAAGEHVVTVHETLAIDGRDGPATALVLELLSGGSLGQVVAARGHLTPGETVTIIAPVARALSGLHDLGVVHGDLSPGNVLLTSTGRPALSDLGFSRLTGEPPGEVHGTDGYVAPEVIEGDEPTRSSDVHALGALAWLCLTGAPPGHVVERADLQAHVPDTPELVSMIQRCLDTDPTARPEADEVARAVFDSVPAEPIRMTSPGDVASSLTRRIRESARAGSLVVPEWQRELTSPVASTRRRRWWQRRPRAKGVSAPPRTARHASPKPVTSPAALGSVPSPARTPLSRPRAIARDAAERSGPGRVPLLVVIGVGLVLAVIVPWQLAGAGDAQGESTPRAAVSSATEEQDTGVVTDRSAPRTSPNQLARELTGMREQMVLDLDPDVLERLDEPGSPAAERDRGLIEMLSGSESHYRGVDLAVRSAHLERSAGRVAVLGVTSDADAYTVVGPEGEEQRPATHGQQVELVLVWHEGAWRVREVR
ncbi:serine/threonine-protein kinase [Janibacter alittae]|uniref:Serine/threonine-protein kinase n=1 Tax=Janibacter alittae TaxID=3115209 RepID=A0ABZ2MKZ8_9MICO